MSQQHAAAAQHADASRAALGPAAHPPSPRTAPAREAPAVGSGVARSGCFGREDELGQLASLYDDACARGGRLALLTGPPGAGKTRILSEFKGRMRLAGAVVLEGRCDAVRAFAPVAEIVERALRFLEEVGVAPSGDVGELAVLLGNDASRAPEPIDGVPELERRLRFFEAVTQLLSDVARLRPPVVLLHDLDRADQGTLDLLAYLLDAGAAMDLGAPAESELRALVVATVRSEVPPAAIVSLARHVRTETMQVGGLSMEGVRALLSAPEVLQKVLTRTGGIPEAINALLEAAPLTPEERVRRRLEELSVSARALAEGLAVYGRAATLDELVSIAGVQPVDPRAAAQLEATDLVHRALTDGRVLFSFSRESDRDRVLAQLDEARRRVLHAGSLDVLERAGLSGVVLQEAAHHAMRAGLARRAVELALEAAPVLAATHAHGEAAALLESVEAMAADDQREALSERLVDLYRATGEYRKAIRRARALASASAQDAAAARRLGELLVLAGEHGEARGVLDRAAELALDDTLRCEVDALRAELSYETARYDEAERWARIALPQAESSGNAALALLVRNTLGKVALARGEVGSAARLFEENRRLAAGAGVRAEHARALTNLGIAMLRRQDMAGAAAAFESALGVAEQIGSTRLVAIARENLAVLAHLRRDYATALGHYQQAVALLKRLGNRPMLARVANNLGELYVRLGDPGRARALCDFAAQMGGGALPRTVVGEGLLLRARISAAEGDSGSAAASFEAARRVFEEIGEAMRVIDACVGLGRLRVDDGDVMGAESALAAAGEVGEPKRAAELALLVADLARASGRAPIAPARRALELAEATDDDELVAPALLRVARAYADQNEPRLALQLVERGIQVAERLRASVPEAFSATYDRASGRLELEALRARLGQDARHTPSIPPPARLPSSSPPPRPSVERATEVLRADARSRQGGIVGRSSATMRIREILERVAPSDATVLVRGESGTGKELVAEALHQGSPRRGRPFVKVNCAALVETLLLSELFGHERGAFTGALARRKGRFELADGGTLFLDEIGDISAKTQVALLRVLQEREFERVGGTQKIRVDVRIVAATNRDLEQMVRDGTFREDLYYRLRGISIELAPLRDRMDDLGPIAEHILDRISNERGEPARTLSPSALSLLCAHRWPGNVRELENVLRSASLFADGEVLEGSDFRAVGLAPAPAATVVEQPLPATLDDETDEEVDGDDPVLGGATLAHEPGECDDVELVYRRVSSGAVSLGDVKREIERECIARALRQTRGNITRAAALLGMKRPRLSQLVKQYELSGVEDSDA